MNLRPYWQFYKSLFPFVAAFGLICLVFFGVIWGFVLACTIGWAVGLFGFQQFKKNQYYFYFNLGITKMKLLKSSFLINLLLALPIFILAFIIFKTLFGRTTII